MRSGGAGGFRKGWGLVGEGSGVGFLRGRAWGGAGLQMKEKSEQGAEMGGAATGGGA